MLSFFGYLPCLSRILPLGLLSPLHTHVLDLYKILSELNAKYCSKLVCSRGVKFLIVQIPRNLIVLLKFCCFTIIEAMLVSQFLSISKLLKIIQKILGDSLEAVFRRQYLTPSSHSSSFPWALSLQICFTPNALS